MFHSTKKSRLQNIINDGLRVNSNKNFTINDYILDIYKDAKPIFLSFNKLDMYLDEDTVLLKLNVNGLRLVADFGTLTEYGAYLEGDHFWFEEVPSELEGFEYDGGSFYYDDFMIPGDAANAAINLTQTAACIDNIEKNRILEIIK